ncbi:MAG TPA: hypothetical protein VGU20_15370 [Stellaceae bacterium]|nr:hypothetical protein [Stellaceae bacterium]
MKKLAAVFAAAFAAMVLIASTTPGRIEPTSVSQIAPLAMMAGQHLASEHTADYSLVFE